MTTAASVDTAEIKLNLVDKTGSGKSVSTDDVRWILIGGRVARRNKIHLILFCYVGVFNLWRVAGRLRTTSTKAIKSVNTSLKAFLVAQLAELNG